MVRRLFDLIVSAAALAVLAVPLLVVGVLIRLSSKGPVLYRQQRIGRLGRPFWLYKFRTMHVNATGSEVTTKGDPRIYPLGQRLRQWKIDELPQLWNVLRGDMSVVGPRPEVERFVRYYTATERRVLNRKPGLASMAQLMYPQESVLLEGLSDPESIYVRQVMPRKIAADLEYERVRTFWSDLRLIGEVAMLVVGKSYRIDRTLQIVPEAIVTDVSVEHRLRT